MTPKKLVLCLMGPTASGKTALAVELCQRFPFEIISVDSAMVYRGLNIGTAKPGPEILQQAPHHLIDIRDPAEIYSAGDFQKDALLAMQLIEKKGKIPLLVGGTMLYFYTLEQGLAELPVQNASLRLEIQEASEQLGWPALHEKLQQVDPEAAARIHPHDSQRIQRALEVYQLTGISITQKQRQTENNPLNALYHFHSLNLSPHNRALLHQRIQQRFLQMLELGFMEEVKELLKRPELTLEKPALRSVGYRQAYLHLTGQLTFEEMKEKAIIATRQLAKRQITWLRRFKEATCFDSEDLKVQDKVFHYLKTLL